jgi:hypothetical protein
MKNTAGEDVSGFLPRLCSLCDEKKQTIKVRSLFLVEFARNHYAASGEDDLYCCEYGRILLKLAIAHKKGELKPKNHNCTVLSFFPSDSICGLCC